MFSSKEIRDVIEKDDFKADYAMIRQALTYSRLGHPYIIEPDIINRLFYFTEAVLASCVDWDLNSNKDILQITGEINEVLAEQMSREYSERKRYRFRSAILYEMAGYPALSSAVSNNGYFPELLDFFKRKGLFGKLGFEANIENNSKEYSVVEQMICHDSHNLGMFEQGSSDNYNTQIIDKVINITANVKLDYNATDILAFKRLIDYRHNLSTRVNISEELFEKLIQIKFPSELWPSQKAAVAEGLLDNTFDCWGMAAPTGTGKTFLARLLIISTIQTNENAKVLYIVPSKALVHEVSGDLEKTFSSLSIKVMAVSAQLTSLDDDSMDEFEKSKILVITPEKADLLLRLSKNLLENVALVVVDEAHHIEAGTRGVLLELYLWRLKKMLPLKTRYIFLSAVAPNIADLTNWLGETPKSLLFEDRANRMKAGVFKVKGKGRSKVGEIHYTDGISIEVIPEKVQSSPRTLLVQLCEKLKVSGPILTVARGKKECEHLSQEMISWLKEIQKLRKLSSVDLDNPIIKRLDSRLEREMYSDVPLREFIKYRIAYHHAGLPPRVRHVLEDAIREGYIDFVFATTTLAEGVNFPFSTVIVQSLALRQAPGEEKRFVPITPRTFWNIAGRAGRPGFDKEGQVILFEPTLGLEKINAVVGDYLHPEIKKISPVKSALSDSIIEIKEMLDAKKINYQQLEAIELDDALPKGVKGSINLLRVGLVHAEAENLLIAPEEIIESSFANLFFNPEQKDFAKNLIITQYKIIESFFQQPNAPSKKTVAGLGLSLDTLARIKNYISSLEPWQIDSFKNLFFGPEINIDQVAFIISPISARMAELEGPKLGGFYTDLIYNWLLGLPISIVMKKTENNKINSIEDLISVIYSRIQYLLPWGLFAADIITQEEAARRDIEYNNEIGKLSHLVDAGVPSFYALRLVNLEFERVDATRLYLQYKKEGGKRKGMDLFGWINSKPVDELERVVKGMDNRALDYDLKKLIKSLK